MRLAFAFLALSAGCLHTAPDPSPTPSDVALATPDPASPPPSAPAAAAPAPDERDPRFVPLIAAAFRDYKAWGRVDDELRWAPWLCRMPLPGRARMSAADDGGHARKLYSVFARHQDRYPFSQAAPPTMQPEGQTLVKESYLPERVAAEGSTLHPQTDDGVLGQGDHFHPYARDGEQIYRAGTFAGVYVLLKLPPGTAGTDAGWIYGTVTPAGEVTSAGRVASCMGCHAAAPHDRAFGLNPAPKP